MKLMKDEKTGLYFRPWTSDLMTIRRVPRVYDVSLFKKSDIVFDLGGHIGVFTFNIAPKVKQVIYFEPDQENFEIGKYNNRNNKNVIFVNSAVVANKDKERYLYKSNTSSEGSHSLHVPSRNERELVSCVNYKDIMKKYKPTIIKAHLEGEEFFIYDKPIHKNVRIFIADFHLKRRVWKELFYKILNNLLIDQGFKPIGAKINITKNPRTIVINLWRNIE